MLVLSYFSLFFMGIVNFCTYTAKAAKNTQTPTFLNLVNCDFTWRLLGEPIQSEPKLKNWGTAPKQKFKKNICVYTPL